MATAPPITHPLPPKPETQNPTTSPSPSPSSQLRNERSEQEHPNFQTEGDGDSDLGIGKRKPKPTTCQTCHSQPAKYTCPRCGHVSCSVGCVKRHKEGGLTITSSGGYPTSISVSSSIGIGSTSTSFQPNVQQVEVEVVGCSGIRNKASYVPMSTYGWGEMMGDYVFLEEVGRVVKGGGEGIVKIGGGGAGAGAGMHTFTGSGIGSETGRGRGRGRGLGLGRGGGTRGGRHHQHKPRSKRELLKLELEKRDITMELVPLGMERGKVNMSCWDYKSQPPQPLLTIELVFHPTPDPLHPNESKEPYKVLRHRISLEDTVESVLCSLVSVKDKENQNGQGKGKGKGKEKTTTPSWVADLVGTGEAKEVAGGVLSTDSDVGLGLEVDCLIRAPALGKSKVYWRLDTQKTLKDALKGMEFVEFPTVEVWEKGVFGGKVVEVGEVGLNSNVNANRGFGFGFGVGVGVGGVVTGEDSEERESKRRRVMGKKEGKRMISGLVGGYGSGSEDEEDEGEGEVKQEVGLGLEAYEDSEDGDGDEEMEVDEKVLLELIRRREEAEQASVEVDEDEVDYT